MVSSDGDVSGPRKTGRTQPGLPLAEVVITFAIVTLTLLFLLNRGEGRDSLLRTLACRNCFKGISLGLRQYADEHGMFPPAYTVDAKGNALHSWRTLILPYMGRQELYDQIDLTKPWDSFENSRLHGSSEAYYACPAARCQRDHTVYCAVVTPTSCLRPKQSVLISEINDGLSQTLAIVEVPASKAVHWMSPFDADESVVISAIGGKGRNHPRGPLVLFADGTISTVKRSAPTTAIRAMISSSGGEGISEDETSKVTANGRPVRSSKHRDKNGLRKNTSAR